MKSNFEFTIPDCCVNPSLTRNITVSLSPSSANTDATSEFIHIPSLVHHAIEGRPLVVSVETRFPLDEAEIQGTWSHASPSGVRATLVTFNKESAITDMTYRERLIFREPNVSLIIRKLRPADEGDYQLNLNIEFHNNTGLVIKEERTVHVTVDGECEATTAASFYITSGLHLPRSLGFLPQCPCRCR